MKYILCLLLPLALFANGHEEGTNYDIVERTINFLIFFGIIYYLIAGKIKDMYNERINSIADKLDSVQAALKSSEQKREDAKDKLQKAKESAKSFSSTSRKEAELLVAKMNEGLVNDLEVLDKSHSEQMTIEKRRMKREVISEILDEMFDGNTLVIDRKEFVDIILKKVA